MKYLIDKQDTYTLIALEEDRLDSSNSARLKSDFVTLHAEGVQSLVLDLGKVVAIDPNGLSAILEANRLCKEANGTFVLCGLSEGIMGLIRLSQLEQSLTILPKRHEAVEYVLFGDIEAELRKELGEE
jgi:anti-sigma B factor antagonist